MHRPREWLANGWVSPEHERRAARSLRDVVTLLREHHQVVTAALLGVLGETGSGREASFARLKRVLSVHEALEQVVVHQRPEVQADAGARVAEETELSKAITHLEAIGAPSDHFGSAFGGLRLAVDAHLQHEEAEELPQLAGDLSDQQRAQVGVGGDAALRTRRRKPGGGRDLRRDVRPRQGADRGGSGP